MPNIARNKSKDCEVLTTRCPHCGQWFGDSDEQATRWLKVRNNFNNRNWEHDYRATHCQALIQYDDYPLSAWEYQFIESIKGRRFLLTQKQRETYNKICQKYFGSARACSHQEQEQ